MDDQCARVDQANLSDQLIDFFVTYITLAEPESGELLAMFHRRDVARGELLLAPGDPLGYIYFVASGLLRIYYQVENKGNFREFNKSFATENMMVAGSMDENGNVSEYGIEALEDSTLMVASLEEFRQAMRRFPVFAEWRRAYLSQLALRKTRREREFLTGSALQRYMAFIEQEPELARRLPQYHIASYLGITDVALSRLRGREFR